MENKYGLGGSKVATEHHDAHHKSQDIHPTECKFCGSKNLLFSASMHDHCCVDCEQWQSDIPLGYSMGRSSDY